MASKSLKDAEQLPKGDTAAENGLDKLVERAKGYHQENPTNGPGRANHEPKVGRVGQTNTAPVVRRSKPTLRESSLPFIQNRDSIHWDAESDSDEDGSTRDRDFVDVTEASASAFTAVNKSQNGNYVNGNHLASTQMSPVNSLDKQSISNGKVYTSPRPSPEAVGSSRKDLQQQCHKLQQLQKHHRLTPTGQPAVRSPPNTLPSTPSLSTHSSANSSFATPTSSRSTNGNGIKPVIAPKPQLRGPARLPNSKASQQSEADDSSSSSESDSGCQSIKEVKSTTV